MKFFRLIRANVDIAPLLAEVMQNEDAWYVDTTRQENIAVQRDTNTIFLCGAPERQDININENQESGPMALAKRFPKAMRFLQEFAATMDSELSRVAIVRLKPKSKVYSHIDKGSYYFIRDRYHLVLKSAAGSILISGDEQVRMKEGELWWFDNRQHHEAENESDEWRIHFIFDLLPFAYKALAVNAIRPLQDPKSVKDVTNEKDATLPLYARSAQLAAKAPPAISPQEEKRWMLDKQRIHLDEDILEKVRASVGLINKRFHVPFLRTHQVLAPYLFEVLPLPHRELTVVASPSPQAIPALRASNDARSLVFEAIRDRAIVRATKDHRLIAPDGGNYDWIIDMRRLFMDARCLDAVAELFWQMYADRLPFQVGGMEVAAIPLVAAILAKSVQRGTPINGFMVRKERKSTGEGKLYEGEINDAPIIIVDDLLNSGTSLEKIRVVLEQESRKISGIFVMIDYHGPGGTDWRARHAIPVVAPFRLSEFDLVAKKPSPASLTPPLFTERWNFAPPDPNFFRLVPKSFPATDGKRVYFGSDCGLFWCLDAANGKVLWNIKAVSPGHKNIWSAPALHDGKVFFGSYDGNVYCLHAETGAEIWRFIEADWVGSSPALAPDLGLLFIGLEFAVEGKRGSVIALDIKTGERVWEHKTKRYTHASPAYWPEKKLVACGSNDNEMFLFDAPTGRMLWRFETKGEGGEKGSIRHAPAFDTKRNHLITGCADGYIYIIDINTGAEVWSIKTSNTIYTVPLVVGDLAFIGSTDKFLYVLDLERRMVKKKIPVYSKIFAPPRLLEGRVYFGACSGMIYQLDPMTGDITGKHQLPDAITNAMTYSPETGLFYALTYVNQLFALKLA